MKAPERKRSTLGGHYSGMGMFYEYEDYSDDAKKEAYHHDVFWKSMSEIDDQVERYKSECGPVITYRVKS